MKNDFKIFKVLQTPIFTFCIIHANLSEDERALQPNILTQISNFLTCIRVYVGDDIQAKINNKLNTYKTVILYKSRLPIDWYLLLASFFLNQRYLILLFQKQEKNVNRITAKKKVF